MKGPARVRPTEDDPKFVELTLSDLDEYHLANEAGVVHDGEEALYCLLVRGNFQLRADRNPVVVPLNPKMPKVSGLEVCSQMRSDERLKMIPAAVLTSSRKEGNLVAGYKLGINSYSVKHVDVKEFVGAVKLLGLLWALINEAPPGSAGRSAKATD